MRLFGGDVEWASVFDGFEEKEILKGRQKKVKLQGAGMLVVLYPSPASLPKWEALNVGDAVRFRATVEGIAGMDYGSSPRPVIECGCSTYRPRKPCLFHDGFRSRELQGNRIPLTRVHRNMGKTILLLTTLAFAAFAQDKPRVFITDSDSWEASGGFGGGRANGVGAGAGGGSGGARPQTAEIMKTFGERCSRVTVTINRDKADYIVILQHEGGKELFRRDNKLAVFDKGGDMILSNNTRTLGNAVKAACDAIRN